MSYNIDSQEIVRGSLEIDPVKARAWHAKHKDDVPECSFVDPHFECYPGTDDIAPFTKPWWYGEGSGNTEELYQQALAELTKGDADIVLTWEGGDSFTGLRVKNGVVTEMGVKFTLVPKGAK